MEETKPQFVVNFVGMNYESDAMRCDASDTGYGD